MQIKTNDHVKIISGKDKGKTGKVVQVFPVEEKVVVEGANKIKKHLRAKKSNEKGQVLELFAPLAVSKVLLICNKCQQPIRVGYKLEGGKKLRWCRKCKQPID